MSLNKFLKSREIPITANPKRLTQTEKKKIKLRKSYLGLDNAINLTRTRFSISITPKITWLIHLNKRIKKQSNKHSLING